MSDSPRLLEEARHDHELVLAAVMMTMELTGRYVNAYTGEPAYTHDDYDDAMAALNRLYVKAAELQRLREALEEIADRDSKWDDLDPYDGLHGSSVRDFARAALAGSTATPTNSPSNPGAISPIPGLDARKSARANPGSTAARKEETHG